jgi:hypothetical protein
MSQEIKTVEINCGKLKHIYSIIINHNLKCVCIIVNNLILRITVENQFNKLSFYSFINSIVVREFTYETLNDVFNEELNTLIVFNQFNNENWLMLKDNLYLKHIHLISSKNNNHKLLSKIISHINVLLFQEKNELNFMLYFNSNRSDWLIQ